MKKSIPLVLALVAVFLASCATSSAGLPQEYTTRIVSISKQELIAKIVQVGLSLQYSLVNKDENDSIIFRAASRGGTTYGGQFLKVTIIDYGQGQFLVSAYAEMARDSLNAARQVSDWGESKGIVRTFLNSFDKSVNNSTHI